MKEKRTYEITIESADVLAALKAHHPISSTLVGKAAIEKIEAGGTTELSGRSGLKVTWSSNIEVPGQRLLGAPA